VRRAVPRMARWLLGAVANDADRASLLADLDEEAAAIARDRGTAAARRWCTRQAIRSVRPLVAGRLSAVITASGRTAMQLWRGWRSDVRLALRRLGHAPGFSLICIATLALGIGGNTAVFTLIDRVVLEPLPVPRPSELYRLGDTDDCCVNSGLPGSFSIFSYDLYRHLLPTVPEFRDLAAFQANVRTVSLGYPDPDAPSETLESQFVSGNYFQMLELTPGAGRLLQPADDAPDAAAVAVLSHRAWMQRFDGRRDVIGEAVTLNGVPATVIGVTPPGFYGETLRPNPAEIWIPLSNEPRLQPAARLLEAKPSHWLYVIGRLRPGVDPASLEPRLTAAVQRWVTATLTLSADERRQIPRQRVAIVSARAGVGSLREAVGPSLRLLQLLAAAVLLIACANLANLLLVRGLARRVETAVRVALGAPRARLAAQFLVESLVLSLAGGAFGLLLAVFGAHAIVAMTFRGAAEVPIDASPSPLVLGFALAASVLTGAVFGSLPAWLGSRSDPVDAMRAGGRTSSERGSRLRRVLLALQVAMSLALIACAGLLVRSLANLQSQDFGFRIEGRYVAAFAPSIGTIPEDRLPSTYADMQQRLRRVPGVRDVAYSLYSPMSGDNWAALITVDGHGPDEALNASWNRVSPRYFETTGTPILRGRAIEEHDRPGSPLVAVVNQTFARKFFGNADPIGRRIGFATAAGGDLTFEIVGIVGDVKYQNARMPAYPTFFLPFLQEPPGPDGAPPQLNRSHRPQALEIAAAAAPASLAENLRRALRGVDRRLAIRQVMTMEEQVAGHFNTDRLIARLALAFGGIALLLACLGLYGLTAHAVARRTREIGIGVPAAIVAGRLLQSTLFGVSGHDPAVLAVAIAMLVCAAAAAALLPARRAASIDPVQALRSE
jgi:macrolide transport system ATP-binding/permease protein